MPKPWTSPEQLAFLNGYLDAFLEARRSADSTAISKFYTILHPKYEAVFPAKEGVDIKTAQKVRHPLALNPIVN